MRPSVHKHRALLVVSVATLVGCGSDPTDPDLGFACGPAEPDGWLWVDVGEGTKPALALASDGTPHLAFMLESLSGWVAHSQIDPSGVPATATTVASGYFYGPIDIDVHSGVPAIVYHDHDREDQVLANRTVSGEWDLEPMANGGHDGWYNSIEVGADGTFHTGTFDPSGFGGVGVNYGRFSGGQWNVEVAAPGSFMYDGGLSLALSPDGTPYIVFFDDVAKVGRIARRNGPGDWEVDVLETLNGELESGRFPQLVIDDAGGLHVAYLARTSTSAGSIRYASGGFGALTVRDVAPINNIQIGPSTSTDGARSIVDIDLLSDDTPVVVYQSRSVTTVARGNGTGFDLEAIPAVAGVRLRQQVSMEIDSADRIHMTYWQDAGMVCYGVQ